MGGEDVDDNEYFQWDQPVVASQLEEAIADKTDEKESIAVDNAADQSTPSEPPRKKAKTPQQILLQTGKNIHEQDISDQLMFLNTAMEHYRLLREVNPSDATPSQSFCAHHLATSTSPSLVTRIRSVVSLQTMKHWKHKASPCILIVCLSARRAVAILKELAPLSLRAIKLFPKSGSVASQVSLLQSIAPCPIAVGTPHRLRQLSTALVLDHTALVVLDRHVSPQEYTVCTLPDTAPECMEFLETVVLPQCWKKKKKGGGGCRVGFL